MRVDLARDAKDRELYVWKQFKVFKPLRGCCDSKAVAETRWALTWEMVNGEKNAKARNAATGY